VAIGTTQVSEAQTYKGWFSRLKKTQKEVTSQEVNKMIKAKEKVTLIDVRESEEYRRGHIPSAVSLPRGFLEMEVEDLIVNRDTPLVLYCTGGVRSLFATETLKNMGYTTVVSMSDGFKGWARNGFAVEGHRSFLKRIAGILGTLFSFCKKAQSA